MAPNKPASEESTPGLPSGVQLSNEQFMMLIETLRTSQSQDASTPALIQALQLQAETQKTYAEEFKRQVRRSNSHATGVSAFRFDPRCEACKTGTEHKDAKTGETLGLAHPFTALRHDVFFCFNKTHAEELTPVEIELYNGFETDKEARNGTWTAKFKQDGSRRQLHVMVPFQGVDAMGNLPPLVQILTELLYGKDIADPTLAMANMAKMQQQIDALTQQLAAK